MEEDDKLPCKYAYEEYLNIYGYEKLASKMYLCKLTKGKCVAMKMSGIPIFYEIIKMDKYKVDQCPGHYINEKLAKERFGVEEEPTET